MKYIIRLILLIGLTILFSDCSTKTNDSTELKSTQTPMLSNQGVSQKYKNFNFAIVSDRTGDHRDEVFENAILKLSKLNPTFVMSIGDLIETSDLNNDLDKMDSAVIQRRWEVIKNKIEPLKVPFFYCVGNNDIRNKKMEEMWIEQFGRTYYHFVYYEVLFIVLNSEDPPGQKEGNFSQQQIDWLEATLKDNMEVKWTFIFLHRPLWQDENPTEWNKVENLIKGMNTTVFAGHQHQFEKTTVEQRNYYTLATTGGRSMLLGIKRGQFDHIVWVSMQDYKPEISNIMLDGIWGDDPPNEIVEINKD